MLAKTSAINLIKTGLARDRREVAHKRRADPLSLIFVDDAESHLCRARLNDDIASGAHDALLVFLLGHGNQPDMVDEVDVEKILGFPFREVVLSDEEAMIEGFAAHTDNSRLEILTILRPLSADLDLFPLCRVSMTEKSVGSSVGEPLVIVCSDTRRQRRQS